MKKALTCFMLVLWANFIHAQVSKNEIINVDNINIKNPPVFGIDGKPPLFGPTNFITFFSIVDNETNYQSNSFLNNGQNYSISSLRFEFGEYFRRLHLLNGLLGVGLCHTLDYNISDINSEITYTLSAMAGFKISNAFTLDGRCGVTLFKILFSDQEYLNTFRQSIGLDLRWMPGKKRHFTLVAYLGKLYGVQNDQILQTSNPITFTSYGFGYLHSF